MKKSELEERNRLFARLDSLDKMLERLQSEATRASQPNPHLSRSMNARRSCKADLITNITLPALNREREELISALEESDPAVNELAEMIQDPIAKVAFTCHHVNGLTWPQTAEVLGDHVPDDTLKHRCNRALARILE